MERRREKFIIDGTSDYHSEVNFEEFTINVTSDYRQNINSLSQTTATCGSRCLSSYVVLVWKPAPSSSTSSASDGTAGGISSSPGQSDNNASSSSFLPEVLTSTCRLCEQPFNGLLHQNSLKYCMKEEKKIFNI